MRKLRGHAMYSCRKPMPQSYLEAAAHRMPSLDFLPAFAAEQALDVDWKEGQDLLEILEMDFDVVAILP